jgi:hypothetical protein
VNDNVEAPIAFITGAAHTDKVVELLEAESVSFAVVSPLALVNEEPGVIYSLAYDRKLARQSVDPPGALGAYLDGRRKPPTSLNTRYLRHKAPIMAGCTAIVRAAAAGAGGGQPPFGVNEGLLQWDGGEIDPFSIEVLEDGDIILAIQISDPERKTLWARLRQINDVSDILDTVSLEKALLDLLDKANSEDDMSFEEQEKFEAEHSDSNPAITAYSRDVIGIVSTSENVIRGTDI